MRKLLVGLLIAGSLCLTFTPRTAVAGSGEVAAGIVGGLAVGTLFGAAVAGLSTGARLRCARSRLCRTAMLLDPRRPCLGWVSGHLV